MASRSRLCIAFFVLGLVTLLPYCTAVHTGMNDEAIVITAAERILDGQVPFRDFDLLYPPGPEYLTAGWVLLSGRDLPAIRLLVCVLAGLMAVVVYLLSSQVLERRFALIPPFLFLLNGMSEWPVVSYHWMGGLGLMTCVTCLAAWLRSPRDGWMVAAGVAAGWAGACVQTEGFAAVVIAVAGLAWLRRLSARTALSFAVGVMLVWGPLVLVVGLAGGLPQMVTDVWTRALGGLYATRSSPYDIGLVTSAWRTLAASWPAAWGVPQALWAGQSLSRVTVWTVKYGLYFPVLLWAGVLAYRRGGAWRLILLTWIVWTLVKRDRFDMLYANYLTPAWYLAAALVVEDVVTRWRQSTFLFLVIGFVFSVNFGFAIRACLQAVHPIHTRAGVLYVADPEEAEAWQALLDQAGALQPPGSFAFAWPYMASFYPLTATRNPTRLDFILPLQHDLAQVEQAAEAVRSADPPQIFYVPLREDALEENPGLDRGAFERETERMNALLTRGYEKAAVVGPLVIYKRSP